MSWVTAYYPEGIEFLSLPQAKCWVETILFIVLYVSEYICPFHLHFLSQTECDATKVKQ